MSTKAQGGLFTKADRARREPVECLGMTFESDDARREYFLERLREHLQDPEFRRTPGFPEGSDEEILQLSDPPYYTACPNPFLGAFIAHYRERAVTSQDNYKRVPYAADIREGKNDPIYNTHSYHTKVPHKAIMRYILHYTNPGDVVLDGFCGTGMTGVAAQLCGDARAIRELGYLVNGKAVVDTNGQAFAEVGPRGAVVADISPVATFIARNLLTPVAPSVVTAEAQAVLSDVADEYSWAYETNHAVAGGRSSRGSIVYSVWSDVFICPECANEMTAWSVVVDRENSAMASEFPCPRCGVILKRRSLERSMETVVDPRTGQPHRRTRQELVLISYQVGKKRFEKAPDASDLHTVTRCEELVRSLSFPSYSFEHTERHLKDGNHLRGVTHSHHYYTARNLLCLAALSDRIQKSELPLDMLFVLTGFVEGHANRRNRYIIDRHHPQGTTCGPLTNTLFIPELQCEVNVFNVWQKTVRKQQKGRLAEAPRSAAVSTASATASGLPDNSVDYVFIDPPFGKNILYSDLNLLWESWLRVRTSTDEEAVINEKQQKGLPEYGDLIRGAFTEFYRVLKPGRWLTLEFHNSFNAVWAAIQQAMQDAGFVIADVRVLDKKHGTIHQDSGYTVKQDLIVSAYKPLESVESRLHSGDGESTVWQFVSSHLEQLHLPSSAGDTSEIIAERQGRLLYDRMVAFHVRRGVRVPLSFSDFLGGLEQRFPQRDQMYFLPEQVARYDRWRASAAKLKQLDLFVNDEATAIHWLRQQLIMKPQSFADLQPAFMKEIQTWSKHERAVELKMLLEQNFLQYDGDGPVPSQIHGYLSTNYKDLRGLKKEDPRLIEKARDRWYVPDPNKQGDLEKLRERALLKEFEEYKTARNRLKEFRTEAVRAGFKAAYDTQDYKTIVDVAGKIPESVLQEDEKLLMYYDVASMRLE